MTLGKLIRAHAMRSLGDEVNVNKYEVTRANGQTLVEVVRADNFEMNEDGSVVFYNELTDDLSRVSVAAFAAGTWVEVSMKVTNEA